MKQLHRNSQKRIYFPGAVYYIVIKTSNNFPYFKENIFCNIFIECLKICKKLKRFKLFGFSLIYDHANLLIQPGYEYDYSQIVKSLKENISRNINIVMGCTEKQNSPQFAGDTTSCRLRGRNGVIFSTNKENYDNIYKINIEKFRQNFINKYGINQETLPKFHWQKSFHDHYIRKDKDFDNHYDYTVYNHLKHGLPENWPYTSLNYPGMIDYPEN